VQLDGPPESRSYEQPGRLPVVIAGALEDAPATTITNAIEMVAAAIQASVFPDGREFELLEHYPGTRAALARYGLAGYRRRGGRARLRSR